MIEKIERVDADFLDKINQLIDAVNTIQKEREADRFEIQEWIGILVAVRKSVNVHEKQIDELQMKVFPEKLASVRTISEIEDAKAKRGVTFIDPYDEYRKWIGKLCRFWDGNKTATQTTDFAYGTLLEIDDYGDFKCDTMTWFDNCEPVKPDSDIIYKGNNNE